MSKYKLIALDMDGTLLDPHSRITARAKEWIGKAGDAGVTVCMATGRGLALIVPFMRELDLYTPIVAANGSEIWRNPDELDSRSVLEPSDVEFMYELSVKYESWFWANGVNSEYNRNHWIGDVRSDEWLKFGYYTDNDKARLSIIDELTARGGLELSNSDPNNIEVNPSGVHKAFGVRRVCELVGCTMDEVVAMGDSLNDLELIRQAGLGIAMGNAQQAVKEAADAVTATNAQDGVAEAIRRYVL